MAKKKVSKFRLFGVLGYPLGHTLSPAMHEAAFRAKGLNAFYLAMELDRKALKVLFQNRSRCSLQGFSVTVPYKQTVMRYLDTLTPQAQAVGAVNTVYRRGQRWAGTNTDVDGFLLSLKKDAGFQPAGKQAVILGAGGAARAAVYALASRKAAGITVLNRHEDRARKLIREFRRRFAKTRFEAQVLKAQTAKAALKEADLIVNATSLGLKRSERSPLQAVWIPKALRNKKKLFFDLIYNPEETALLKAAKRKGHDALNGVGMLAYQGASAWPYWMKQKAPAALMRRTLEQALSGGTGR